MNIRYTTIKRGCRLAWSRLVASGVTDESSNLSSPTTELFIPFVTEKIVKTLWELRILPNSQKSNAKKILRLSKKTNLMEIIR
jgi:hypothetical protein